MSDTWSEGWSMIYIHSNAFDKELMRGDDARRIDEETVKICRGPLPLQEEDKIQQFLRRGRQQSSEQFWDSKASVKCHDLQVNEIDER